MEAIESRVEVLSTLVDQNPVRHDLVQVDDDMTFSLLKRVDQLEKIFIFLPEVGLSPPSCVHELMQQPEVELSPSCTHELFDSDLRGQAAASCLLKSIIEPLPEFYGPLPEFHEPAFLCRTVREIRVFLQTSEVEQFESTIDDVIYLADLDTPKDADGFSMEQVRQVIVDHLVCHDGLVIIDTIGSRWRDAFMGSVDLR